MRDSYEVVKAYDRHTYERIVVFCSTIDASLAVTAQVEKFIMSEVAEIISDWESAF